MKRASLLPIALLSLSCARRPGADPRAEGVSIVKTKAGIEMVRVPGGSFVMGSGGRGGVDEIDEDPHEVSVGAFLIDRCEVTQAEYERLMGKNPSRWTRPENPVEQIRWTDAVRYANARSREEGLAPAYDEKTWACDFAADGYRLPTEAEWECACRAGTETIYSFGDRPAPLKEHAWFKNNQTRSPQAAATRAANPWGLYDMYGNVWEWCNDFYEEDYYKRSPREDPRGPETGQTRVVRGGCWNSRADQCRSSYRGREDPGYTDACFGADIRGFVGFRCVRPIRSGSSPR
ncbi:MAG: formylglycine-generating enzyme family protein [Planctomycetes bacterium]|nr:formylglycine-generating enzyme family protein [Planctomycetota bacterium]